MSKPGNRTRIRRLAAGFAALTMLTSGLAEAQWVFLGRKAVGAIRQMSGSPKSGQGNGYDSASVLLDASAEKVYQKALAIITANMAYQITQKNDQALTLEFTDGKIIAGLQVNSFEERLSQLLIVSNSAPAEKSGSSLVVNGVLRICKEMEIHCEVAPR